LNTDTEYLAVVIFRAFSLLQSLTLL